MTVALSAALKFVSSSGTDSQVSEVLRAVKAIASSATPQEDPSLAQAVDVLIKKGKNAHSPNSVQTMVFSVLAIIKYVLLQYMCCKVSSDLPTVPL